MASNKRTVGLLIIMALPLIYALVVLVRSIAGR